MRKRIADTRVLWFIEAYLKASILDLIYVCDPVRGAPQWAVLSPLLSNLYLNDLYHLMASRFHEMTRYADDMVIQCRTPEEAESALALVRDCVGPRGLTLHPTKNKYRGLENRRRARTLVGRSAERRCRRRRARGV